MTAYKSFAPHLLALSLGLTAVPVLAGDDCDAPIQHWQSREAVKRMAAQKHWEVQRLKIDDGCYEIRGMDAEGRSFEAKIDPETLELVKMKVRDRDHDRDYDGSSDGEYIDYEADREGPRASEPGAAQSEDVRPFGAATPGDTRLFTPGTAPRGQIE